MILHELGCSWKVAIFLAMAANTLFCGFLLTEVNGYRQHMSDCFKAFLKMLLFIFLVRCTRFPSTYQCKIQILYMNAL